jgi:serine/threonine protein phosphatase PrpC
MTGAHLFERPWSASTVCGRNCGLNCSGNVIALTMHMHPSSMSRAVLLVSVAYHVLRAPCLRRCTGITAVVQGRRLWIAHVGDSRAVLCSSSGGARLAAESAACCSLGRKAYVRFAHTACSLSAARGSLQRLIREQPPVHHNGQYSAVSNIHQTRLRAAAAEALSHDHKPARNDEHNRIENAGGAVIWAGTWRVSGVLAVSRAFGDRPLKKFVISRPDVRRVDVGDGEEFVVLASDGIWDVISNQARAVNDALEALPCQALRRLRAFLLSPLVVHAGSVVVLVCRVSQDCGCSLRVHARLRIFEHMQAASDMVRKHKDKVKASAKALADEAIQRGSTDNVSCVVVRFAPAAS